MRLIDVDKLKNDLCFVDLSYNPKKEDEFSDGYACGINGCRRTIERQKIVDAVSVVRCKDCAVPHNAYTGCPKVCGRIVGDDWFCADGERKDGEQNEHN